MRRIHLLTLLAIMGLATVPFASAQNQSAAAPASSTVNSLPASDSVMGVQSVDNLADQAETDLNSPTFTHFDFRGTLLEKAYQQEPQSGWQNPNLTKSAGTIGAGGN
jgi:hypothetical protein